MMYMWCTKIWKFDRHNKLLPKMLAVYQWQLTWNGPGEPHWNQTHPRGPRIRHRWKRCDLRTNTHVTFPERRMTQILHGHIHTLTAAILYPQDKVSAGIADRFHRDARVLLHRCLCKQLPCRTGGQITATNTTLSFIQLVQDGNG